MICIGILAYNEADAISHLLQDLARQDLLLEASNVAIEIRVLANGCMDDTAALARAETDRIALDHVKSFVHEIQQPGKANAWNHLVHELVAPKTTFLFMLDADIRLPQRDSLRLVYERLMDSDHAIVAVDRPIRDLALRAQKTLLDRIILVSAGTSTDIRSAITGQFYCAMFHALKNIRMPTGILVEDGFLRAMLLTSNFTTQEDRQLLLYVEGACHVFQAPRNVAEIFHHNVRLAVGTEVNRILYDHFTVHALSGAELEDYIRRRNDENPRWVYEEVRSEIVRHPPFLAPRDHLGRRLAALRRADGSYLRRVLAFTSGFLFDFAVFAYAARALRRGNWGSLW